MSILQRFDNFVVIIGWDKFADLITEQLVCTKRQIIALVDDQQIAERINAGHDNNQVIAIKMDYFNFEKIKKLPLDRAFGVYINLESDRDRLIYIFKLRKYFPQLSIISPVLNQKLKESFSLHRKIFPLSRNDQLYGVLAELEDERMFLQGDFRLLLLRFNRSDAQLEALNNALEPLPSTISAPDVGLSAAELEEKINALEALMTELEARSELLQHFHQKQQEVADAGEAFSIGAGFLQEHLSKMHLLIELSDARELPRHQQLNPAFI